MQAVERKLVGRDIIPDVAGSSALNNQVSNEVGQVLPCPADVLVAMQQRPEFAGMALVLNECVGIEHCFEPLDRFASLVSECSKMFEMACDVTFVPGDQDRFDV